MSMPSLTLAVGAPSARIMATGAYRPSRVVTNAEICERIDSSDEWIRERSGIEERRWAGPTETVVQMASAAANTALERSGIDRTLVDMVLLATVTHPYATPSAAAEVTELIGTHGAAAMDISAACAGFSYGVGLAHDMVRGGSARYVVVVGVEKLSEWTNHDDRGTAFLFADGAGAVVIGPSESPAIGPVVWGSDGTQKTAIEMTSSLIDSREPGAEFPTIVMQGQQVFRWAVSEMAKVCQHALDAAGIRAEDLVAFIPHQANNRITDAMIRAMGLPESVLVARDIITTGNTSAASIPLAMDRLLTEHPEASGGYALIIGFGAGLVYAAQVVTLP